RHQARVHHLAVDRHRAGPALPLAAAFLGAGQVAVLAQDVEQPPPGRHVDLVTDPVDRELELHRPPASRSITSGSTGSSSNATPSAASIALATAAAGP